MMLIGTLENIIDTIKAGNCKLNSEQMYNVIKEINKLNTGIKRISKDMACTDILHCSHSTFNNYLAMGLIPPGRKEKGFKELFWAEHDFQEALTYQRKHKEK